MILRRLINTKPQSQVQGEINKENTTADSGEETKGRNQARRSRRGGRRRRPRTESDNNVESNAGNKALPEKKVVEGMLPLKLHLK